MGYQLLALCARVAAVLQIHQATFVRVVSSARPVEGQDDIHAAAPVLRHRLADDPLFGGRLIEADLRRDEGRVRSSRTGETVRERDRPQNRRRATTESVNLGDDSTTQIIGAQDAEIDETFK